MNQGKSAHIAEIGQERFDRALMLAELEIRKDSHFVGMDKIRAMIAEAIALKATGYKVNGISFGRNADPPAETVEICDKLFRSIVPIVTLQLGRKKKAPA